MKQKNIIKEITNFFDKDFGLESKYEIQDNGAVSITCDVTLNNVNDASVLIKIIAFESGTTYISFIFNKVKDEVKEDPNKVLELYDLLNSISADNIFKAYVTETGYVTLAVDIYNVGDEGYLKDTLNLALNDLVSDNLEEVLNKINGFLEE